MLLRYHTKTLVVAGRCMIYSLELPIYPISLADVLVLHIFSKGLGRPSQGVDLSGSFQA